MSSTSTDRAEAVRQRGRRSFMLRYGLPWGLGTALLTALLIWPILSHVVPSLGLGGGTPTQLLVLLLAGAVVVGVPGGLLWAARTWRHWEGGEHR